MYNFIWSQAVLADDRRRDVLREAQRERVARQFTLRNAQENTLCCGNFTRIDPEVSLGEPQKVA